MIILLSLADWSSLYSVHYSKEAEGKQTKELKDSDSTKKRLDAYVSNLFAAFIQISSVGVV
ncbi:hypothetical protein NCCP2331_10460 [Sporosarcina sp. NCCP-2331]|nr:hypothetical protein NCCP2331_10460 [Sporosarcina sp. NCCP-2331]GLB55003.1 hypothetical protein NCCP2378_07880 [Sporosarcina sp. NCCP-2378]